MRVIAGTARRLQLEAPEGLEVRPTSDRIKETLFNILQNDIPGCRFLDLFAGSGGIGIEALSRGAARAVFVDRASAAIRVIEKNLRHTKLLKNARVLPMDYMAALKRLWSWGEVFDIIFIDPPYADGVEMNCLKEIAEKNLLAVNGTIIIEAALKTELKDIEASGWEIFREKIYKTNKHYFIRKKEEACTSDCIPEVSTP